MKTMDMLAEALAAAGNDGAADAMLEARLLSRLAQETYHVQRFEDAKKMSARALDAMPRDGAPASRAAVMDGRAWTLHTPQDLGDRLALADEMVAEAMQARDPEWEMMARSWRCTALLELGEVAAIDIELDRCAVLAREAPVPSHLFRISTLRCTRAMMSGAFDTGATLAEEAYRIGSTIEPENALQTYCAQMLAACREQGLLVGLVDTAEQMVADFPMVPGWRCALAFVNLEAGITDRAGELFDELAATDFRQVPRDLAWLQAHSYLAEVAVALDRPRPAGLLYRSLKPFAGRNVGLYDIASNGAVDYYLGVLAAATERRTTAIRHLRRAVGFNDRTGQVPAATRARVALAAQLLTGTEPERAESRILLAAAAQVASAGGLVRIATEIEPLASQLCGAGS
jgi:tetratricopeptide (TPR) repeat protein